VEVDTKNTSGKIGQISKDLEWRLKNRPKSTIMGHFWGIFNISRGEKGTLDQN
jgi:hypothetical protein